MAFITTPAGNVPNLGGGLVIIDTVLSSTASEHSWVSTYGAKFTFFGTFTYPGGVFTGNVDSLLLDTGNNGTTDLQFDFDAAMSAALFNTTDASVFWSNAFSEIDNAFISTPETNLFSGFGFDGFIADINETGFGDFITISGSGRFSGDFDLVQQGFTGGSDDIVLNFSTAPANIRISGDGHRFLSDMNGGTISGGADTIADISGSRVTERALELYGDFDATQSSGTNSNITFNGADDIIQAGVHDANVFGDFVGTRTNGNGNVFNGGDDTISITSGRLYGYGDFGDLGEINQSYYGGDDTIDGGSSNDTVYGDMPRVSGNNNVVDAGMDTINGGGSGDLLFGDLDRVTGFGNSIAFGSDVIHGNEGEDRIYGDFRDPIAAGNTITRSGNNFLYGDSGFDLVVGGFGDDLIDGGADIDTTEFILSQSGVVVNLGNGNNAGFATGFGNDTLYRIENVVGSNFNDTIIGNNDKNVIQGGAGNDNLNGASGRADVASYQDATAGVTVDLRLQGSAQNTQGAGTDTLRNFESIYGSDFDDVLRGDSSNNVIYSNSGDDRVFDGAGDDEIDLGSDDDYVRVGGGVDEFYGGSGSDHISYFDSAGGVTLDLLTNTASGSWADDDVVESFENATGSNAGNDQLRGTAEANVLLGYGGDDFLQGRGGADRILGGNGDDTVYGGAGNDFLRGLNDNDTLNGGNGDDRIFGDAGNDSMFGGNGNDYMNGGNGDDEMRGGDGDDILQGRSGKDRLYGEAGDDILRGDSQIDVLAGGSGNDFIDASGGNDIARGNSGADTILGGSGSDLIIGGTGGDITDGGTGANTFVFNTDDGADRIRDWSLGNNQIDFSANSHFNSFGNVTAAMTDLSSGHLRIRFDADNELLLLNTLSTDLNASDFIF